MEKHSLGHALTARMSAITDQKVQEKGLRNASANLPRIKQGKSIRELLQHCAGRYASALVIAAGPSIKRRHSGDDIRLADFGGAIIATESAMLYCLRRGIVPDLVVTVDPIRLIVRWFGDPDLNETHIHPDDYISRQDLDESFHDQIRVNQEIIDLVDRYGPEIKIAVASSSAPNVVERIHQANMDVYWWNPMYDDPAQTGSITRQVYRDNHLPCVNAGGNVGSACWMFADTVFGSQRIGLMGMDFGYYRDLPYRNTQYYEHAVELFGEDHLDDFFVDIYNEHVGEWFYTDPTYLWYKQNFLEMVANSDADTYNCTEGGIVFGDNINFVDLADFLNNERELRRRS